MDDYSKIHTGEIYYPTADDIMEEQMRYQDRNFDYNQTKPSQQALRTAMLPELFAEVGEGCYIEAPYYANWGGHHVHLGKNIYMNYGTIFVDDTHIYVGDRTKFGPNVIIATAGHPILPQLREKAYQYNLPVHIGSNCWLGAGVIVLPGVTIGDNSVIGAGSVVTKDIPANVVAVGNPCRVLRPIGEKDRVYYNGQRTIPEELLND